MADHQRSLVLFELPVPTTRSRRQMASLQRSGISVAAVHAPKDAERVAGFGIQTVPAAMGRGHRLRGEIQRKIRTAESATWLGHRQQALWRAALDMPTPQIAHRSADLNILAYEWVAGAEALVAQPADIYWAADLDALPPVVWAGRASPGTRLVYDAHELFMRLDYLDPLQLPEWDAIARQFVPKVDLVLTVCDGIADILRVEYGARRVQVVHNLAVAGRPTSRDVRQALGLPAGTPLAVHIGNVVPNRRPELAVPLLEKLEALHVVFVGEIRQQQDVRVREQAVLAGVQDRLHIIDPVPVDELISFVAGADLSLVLYSPMTSDNLRLALPNKLFDSLAAGLPLVAAHGTEAAAYVINRNLGRGFDDGDADSLAKAVQGILNDHMLRERVSSRRHDFEWAAGEPMFTKLVHKLAATATPEGPDGASGDAPAAFPPRPATDPLGNPRPPSWRHRPVARARKAAAWRLRRLSNVLDPRDAKAPRT